MTGIIACIFIITGEVQEVGYRFFSQMTARRHHITGHVRNRGDGSVEIFAQGSASDLNTFAAALVGGPPFSAVDRVERTVASTKPAVSDFQIIR